MYLLGLKRNCVLAKPDSSIEPLTHPMMGGYTAYSEIRSWISVVSQISEYRLPQPFFDH